MQIAVCLSGAERLESPALTHFARNLPADAAIDCYAFFWEGGPLSDEAALRELINQKTEGRFRTIEVQVGRNFAMDLDLAVQAYPETNIENVIRMYRGIRRCNDMKLRRELTHGARYDHVIRTRPEIQLASTLDLARFMPLTREFIVFPENGHWRGGLNDQFAFGASEKMDMYSLVIDYIPEHCANGCPFHPETLLRFHLTRMQIMPILAPISVQLVRT
ncbi:hypothetical protein LJR225_000484 [Phenylobacterium sp. LjRoot225]|uniref:hypothetical protein n=1 Tax=Phenylobacterium sp. LjRoot225 TaxID=3342285 RepID=UPI003ECF23F0